MGIKPDYESMPYTENYYGVFEENDGIKVDFDRFHSKIGFNNERYEYLCKLVDNDGYLHPKKEIPRHYNAVNNSMNELVSIWHQEYVPILKHIKTPQQVQEENRLGALCYTCNMVDYDDICVASHLEGIRRINAYKNVMRMIYLQYFCTVIAKSEHIIYQLMSDFGYTSPDYTVKLQKKFLKSKNINLGKLEQYNEYNSLRKIYIFLKHGTKSTYDRMIKDQCAKQFVLMQDYDSTTTAFEYITKVDTLLEQSFGICDKYLKSICYALSGENEFTELETEEYYLRRAKEQLEI